MAALCSAGPRMGTATTSLRKGLSHGPHPWQETGFVSQRRPLRPASSPRTLTEVDLHCSCALFQTLMVVQFGPYELPL